MTTHSRRNQFLLVLLALFAVSASPLRAEVTPNPETFFSPQVLLGDDQDGNPVYYLDYFNTYTYAADDDTYVYKYNFGWLYSFGGDTSETDDIYFYDFTADDVLYTSPSEYPSFYSFNLDSFIYYFEGSSPREFYNFDTDQYIYY